MISQSGIFPAEYTENKQRTWDLLISHLQKAIFFSFLFNFTFTKTLDMVVLTYLIFIRKLYFRNNFWLHHKLLRINCFRIYPLPPFLSKENFYWTEALWREKKLYFHVTIFRIAFSLKVNFVRSILIVVYDIIRTFLFMQSRVHVCLWVNQLFTFFHADFLWRCILNYSVKLKLFLKKPVSQRLVL